MPGNKFHQSILQNNRDQQINKLKPIGSQHSTTYLGIISKHPQREDLTHQLEPTALI